MSQETYSDQELQKFEKTIRDRIELERAELADLEMQREEAGNREQENNDSYGDDAKADQILSRLSTLVEHKQQYMQRLQASLVRIENGTYGLDIDTGEKIDIRRLEAEPTALRNIPAEQKA